MINDERGCRVRAGRLHDTPVHQRVQKHRFRHALKMTHPDCTRCGFTGWQKKDLFVLFKCCFVSFSFCLIFSLCVNETSVGLWGKWAQLRCPPVDAAGTTTAAASAAATTVTVSTVLTVAAAKNLMLTYIHITITCGKFPWLTITRYWYDVSTQGCRSGYI